MDCIEQIKNYIAANEQESQDKKVILEYIKQFPHNIFLRENEFAHITSSGFIMNKELNKVLLVHHNILNTWSWTGGHADGETDLLQVAVKEAKEETGINFVVPLVPDIASLDILPVGGHWKRGSYISAHLHLSIAYILVTDEQEKLVAKKDENSGVKWFSVTEFTDNNFSQPDIYLYSKLINRAQQLRSC